MRTAVVGGDAKMLHILLCEDEEKYIESFISELGGNYYSDIKYTGLPKFKCGDFEIEVCHDLNVLDFRLRTGELPDLLVLDLYWPKIPGQGRSEFEKAVEHFNNAVDELKQKVPLYLI